MFFLLKHELVHLKRKDVYWKLLFVAANAFHWFNPLIWVMHREAVVDLELSCDERVLEGAGARLPVIADTFSVLGAEGNAADNRGVRSGFFAFTPADDMASTGNLRFMNGLEVFLPKEWAGNVVAEIFYAPGEGNNSDTLIVCEKSNAEAGAGGVLFYLHYIDKDYYEFSADMPYQMFGEQIDRVIGVYRPDGHEYALVFELPREMNYVEGNEEMRKAYEDAFAFVDDVRVATGNMKDFVECRVDDLDWVAYME